MTKFREFFRANAAKIIDRMVPREVQELDSLVYWRVRIFFFILLLGLALTTLTLIPSFYLAFKKGFWGLIACDAAAYVLSIVLVFAKWPNYRVRAGLIVFMFYLVGVWVLLAVGPFSGGPAWLFGFAILVGELFGAGPAILALVLNIATVFVFGALLEAGVIHPAFDFNIPGELMLSAVVNFIMVNSIAVLSVTYLFRSMIKMHEKEKALAVSLAEEKARLMETMRALQEEMTERERAEKETEYLAGQLQHARKMEAVGTLAGGVAHDFNNILQAISGNVQTMAGSWTGSPEDRRRVSEIHQSISRASDLVQRLLAFSRKVEPEFALVDLNLVVAEVVSMLERVIPKMIGIETSLAPDLDLIEADATQIIQVLLNLGTNAADAMPEGGRLTISTANVPAGEAGGGWNGGRDGEGEPGRLVRIEVADTGTGIAPEDLEQVFDPFFTTKEIGKGTGLGLALAYGIVANHGGFMECDSRPGGGATFRVVLPAKCTRRECLPAPQPRLDQPLDGHETVLLVDDEFIILETAKDFLTGHGYKTVSAGSGEQAVDYFSRHADEIDIVILDLGMPGMGGRKCLEMLKAIRPEAKVVISSGYSPKLESDAVLTTQAAGFIHKPYMFSDLLAKVREILDA